MTRMGFHRGRRLGVGLALGTLVAYAIGLTGCTTSDTVGQRCGVATGNDSVLGDETMRKIIACAGLTPSDTYRVDLEQAILRQDYSSWSVDSVREHLATWKQSATESEQWQFLINNPASAEPLPELKPTSLRQVVVTVWDHDASSPSQFWFDFENARVVWSDEGSVLGDPDDRGTSLTDTVAGALVDTLDTYLPHWDRLYPTGTVAKDTPASAILGWSVALCFQDYSLFRYSSNGQYDNTPSDFQGFMDGVRSVVS